MEIRECKRNNLCVDCDDPECGGAGMIVADCLKYYCDNEKLWDCENCWYMKQHQVLMRAQYQKGAQA